VDALRRTAADGRPTPACGLLLGGSVQRSGSLRFKNGVPDHHGAAWVEVQAVRRRDELSNNIRVKPVAQFPLPHHVYGLVNGRQVTSVFWSPPRSPRSWSRAGRGRRIDLSGGAGGGVCRLTGDGHDSG